MLVFGLAPMPFYEVGDALNGWPPVGQCVFGEVSGLQVAVMHEAE